jgi:hypothetical protein
LNIEHDIFFRRLDLPEWLVSEVELLRLEYHRLSYAEALRGMKNWNLQLEVLKLCNTNDSGSAWQSGMGEYLMRWSSVVLSPVSFFIMFQHLSAYVSDATTRHATAIM